MPEKNVMKNLQDFYLIDTKTLSNEYKGIDFEYRQVDANPEYAELLKLQKERKLQERFAGESLPAEIKRSANNFHVEEMYTGDPNTLVCEDIGEGLIPIEDEETAKKVLEILLRRDKDIKLSRLGKQFTEAKKK